MCSGEKLRMWLYNLLLVPHQIQWHERLGWATGQQDSWRFGEQGSPVSLHKNPTSCWWSRKLWMCSRSHACPRETRQGKNIHLSLAEWGSQWRNKNVGQKVTSETHFELPECVPQLRHRSTSLPGRNLSTDFQPTTGWSPSDADPRAPAGSQA